jgi:hypothetical protein
MRSGLSQAGLNSIQSKPKMFAANSANFGLEQRKFNEHYNLMAQGGISHQSQIGRHNNNPYNRNSPLQSRSDVDRVQVPMAASLGRHSSNPTSLKNLHYLKNIAKPVPRGDDVYNIDIPPQEMEPRRSSAMTQMENPSMGNQKRANPALYQSAVVNPVNYHHQ